MRNLNASKIILFNEICSQIIKTATSYSCEGAGKNGLGESFSWLTLAACADKVKQVSAVLTYIQLHGDILGAG